MVSKILLAVCLLLAVASVAPQAAGPWGAPAWGPPAWGSPAAAPAWGPPGANMIPPWVASAAWFPRWGPCTTVGASCTDCNTRQVCTKIGGIQRACADPLLPYCNLGECSATPTAECAPVPVVPASNVV